MNSAVSTNFNVSGVFTFINIIWVLSIFMILIGALVFFGHYLIAFPAFTETIVWLFSCTLIIVAKRFQGHIAPFIALTGCLLIACAYTISCLIHSSSNRDSRLFFQTLMLLCVLVWTPVAMVYKSKLIGFFTVLALEGLLGFAFNVTPFCVAIGFHDNDSMVRAGTASLFLIIISSLMRLNLLGDSEYFEPFEFACLFVGTFVYSLTLLIISHKYYSEQNYVASNVLTIISGLLALFLGSVFPSLSYLRGIGGTFFMIYLLIKYVELRGSLSGGFLLTFGIILWVSSFAINRYRNYFILSLFNS